MSFVLFEKRVVVVDGKKNEIIRTEKKARNKVKERTRHFNVIIMTRFLDTTHDLHYSAGSSRATDRRTVRHACAMRIF